MTSKFISELQNRGLIFDHTVDITSLHEIFDEKNHSVKFYIGFDPTADSLHVGSLQQLIIMSLAKQFGHQPIALVGGATASIGDPSFKDTMRPIMSKEIISNNTNSITSQIANILGDITIVNNLNWTSDINLLDFLRDFGKHFSVNRMLSFSSVKDRLERENQGLSILEFSYSMLQAFDFFHLNDKFDVTVQMGGSDQFSNIIQGIDLVHKINGKKVIGITNPLVLKPDGTKMGKTTSGAVWLDKNKTSVFDFFQFWRNIDDNETVELTKRFLGKEIFIDENINQNKENLALSMIEFVHGKEEKNTLEKSLKNGTASKVIDGSNSSISTVFDAIMFSNLFSSKSEVRRMIRNKETIIVNGVKILTEDELSKEISEKEIAIQKGKKHKVSINLK